MKLKDEMHVLLVATNFKEKWNKLDLSCKENLAILSLSSFLKSKGIKVTAVNAQLDQMTNEEILEKYKSIKFDLIAVSCSPQKLYEESKDFIFKARRQYRDAYIVMGGIFATLSYKEILQDILEIDAISLGEGEFSLLGICDALCMGQNDMSGIHGLAYRGRDGIVVNDPERILNLDQLPFPERNPMGFGHANGITAYVIAGKGCYGNCSYCSIQSCFNYHRRICRGAKNVVDEIQMLLKEYGVTHIQFHDDIFFDYSKKSQAWLDDFVEEIERRKLKFSFRIYLRPNDIRKMDIERLKKIGLQTVFIGAESGVQRILNEMNKHITPEEIVNSIDILKECGVEVHLGFITLIPTMSFEELEENYNFLYNLGVEVCNDANLHNRLNIYNGCEYEKILDEYGLLKEKKNFWDIHSYRFIDPLVQKYHDELQKVKEYARNTKVLENELVKQYGMNTKKAKEIMHYGVEMWMCITRKLLSEVKKSGLDEMCDLSAIFHVIDEFEEHHHFLLKGMNVCDTEQR